MNHPILYSFRRCPYAMRARMALWVSGQVCELREVVLKNKPAHMLSISPKGTVPVLLLPDGRVLEESLEIMEWGLAKKDPHDWLKPDRDGLEETKKWIARCDGDFKHHLDRTKYATRYEGADPEVHRQDAELFLATLDQRLGDSNYLFGSRLTFGDAAIAPFIRQFAFIDENRFDASPFPHLQNWLKRFLDSKLFNQIMDKYAPWEMGSPTVFLPVGPD
jgi:glutathione S-transferase